MNTNFYEIFERTNSISNAQKAYLHTLQVNANIAAVEASIYAAAIKGYKGTHVYIYRNTLEDVKKHFINLGFKIEDSARSACWKLIRWGEEC